MKNKKNMGFSLVELIVVVAIMAVLVGVLAPAYLGYVEKTRKGTDENAAEEIRRAVENAIAGDLDVYDEVKAGITLKFADGDKIVDFTTGSATGTTSDDEAEEGEGNYAALRAALTDVFGDKKFDCQSKAYNDATLEVTIGAAATGSTSCTVTSNLVTGTEAEEPE